MEPTGLQPVDSFERQLVKLLCYSVLVADQVAGGLVDSAAGNCRRGVRLRGGRQRSGFRGLRRGRGRSSLAGRGRGNAAATASRLTAGAATRTAAATPPTEHPL